METFSFSSLLPYLPPAAVLAFLVVRSLRYKSVKVNIPQLAKDGAIFVDVRTPAEFAAGARPGSLNIPLDALARRAGELDKEKTIVLSCASGARSGSGVGRLKRLGFKNVVNAGPWQNTL
ncbi:MAG: rhodanese-like domain-containing protein [Elusimicrobiales bacterium]|nr:rhodanese-like domain-containing protein [Elusimicrobiales bacterium]